MPGALPCATTPWPPTLSSLLAQQKLLDSAAFPKEARRGLAGFCFSAGKRLPLPQCPPISGVPEAGEGRWARCATCAGPVPAAGEDAKKLLCWKHYVKLSKICNIPTNISISLRCGVSGVCSGCWMGWGELCGCQSVLDTRTPSVGGIRGVGTGLGSLTWPMGDSAPSSPVFAACGWRVRALQRPRSQGWSPGTAGVPPSGSGSCRLVFCAEPGPGSRRPAGTARPGYLAFTSRLW